MTIDRRDILKLSAAFSLTASTRLSPAFAMATTCGPDGHLPVSLDEVPWPEQIAFTVHGGGAPVTLRGHYWFNAAALREGRKCPAIVELNPYRRRDGMMYPDSMMYPWFAANEYLCFRVDLQGSGDSEGTITDEYTEEELANCIEVIRQIAALPICTGSVGMMGKSWSAINTLMVAARDDCPEALKAILFCAGSDDRFNDDVHYMGGAMMLDNTSWPSDMWAWLPLPPDPAVVGDAWREIWRNRIRSVDFWFKQWGEHQTRDAYWAANSVRGQYDRVKVPVFTISGWQDGYRNVTERQVRALGGMGRHVTGLIGAWGHKYPFDGWPGPRVDWLPYVVRHFWDRWLKGIEPEPGAGWPEFVVWLGESRPPGRSPDFTDRGAWVAEDHDWMSRVREVRFHLWPEGRLRAEAGAPAHDYISKPDVTLGLSALETSSWGECDNDDLPSDTSEDDRRSIALDTEPLAEEIACFGYPRVELNLACDKPLASLAIRLCEVSPEGASRVVTYTFANLATRGGETAEPVLAPDRPFRIAVDLNLLGHVFKRGWRIRLSLSPYYFPTMWASPELATVTVKTGRLNGFPESVLVLPGRQPRAEDADVGALVGPPRTVFADPDRYVPTIKTIRNGSSSRRAMPIEDGGRRGMKVRKVFDSGRSVMGGALDRLTVDQIVEEEVTILADDPLSATAATRSESRLERDGWKVRTTTATRIWSERLPSGEAVFRYQAELRAFEGEMPFEERRVEGTIPRRWV